MKRAKEFFLVLVIGLFCGHVSLGNVRAEERGSLKMNHQVIYENNQQKNSSKATFIIPDLFLPRKTEREKNFEAQKETPIKEIEEKVFLSIDKTDELVISEKVTPLLFKQSNSNVLIDTAGFSVDVTDSTNYFWQYSGVVLGGGVVLALGTFLGHRFSYHRVQKEH